MAKKKRFETIYSEGAIEVNRILVDKETGVHYLYAASGSAGGITPLLDANGEVVVKRIYDEDK